MQSAIFRLSSWTAIGLAMLSIGTQASAQVDAPVWDASQILRRIGDEREADTRFWRAQAVRLETGTIAVLNAATRELRLFSGTGGFIRRLAGPGPGPGEFQQTSMIMTRGGSDTIFVIERPIRGPGLVHRFTAAGGFLGRSFIRSANAPPGGVLPSARLTGETYLVTVGDGLRVLPDQRAGTLVRDSLGLGLLTLDPPGRYISLGTFADLWRYAYNVPSSPGGARIGTYILGPRLVLGATAGRAWVGDAESGRISIVGPHGERTAQFVFPVRSRPYDLAALARVRERAIASARDPAEERARFSVLHSRRLMPTTAPRFSRFLPGYDGEMWVELFREDPLAPPRFVVLNSSGQVLAQVTLPMAMRVDDVGRDYVLGVAQDGDGVEEVVLLRLQR